MQPDIFRRYVPDGLINRSDVQPDHFLKHAEGLILVSAVTFHGQVGAIELQS